MTFTIEFFIFSLWNLIPRFFVFDVWVFVLNFCFLQMRYYSLIFCLSKCKISLGEFFKFKKRTSFVRKFYSNFWISGMEFFVSKNKFHDLNFIFSNWFFKFWFSVCWRTDFDVELSTFWKVSLEMWIFWFWKVNFERWIYMFRIVNLDQWICLQISTREFRLSEFVCESRLANFEFWVNLDFANFDCEFVCESRLANFDLFANFEMRILN